MKPLFGRVVLNETAGRARPCDAYRPYGSALQHEPAE
jgi:hypothetical protein